MVIPVEDISKIIEAFIAGALLGIEREYRSKPAGLRTLILITVGSTLFSMLSLSIVSDSPDRVASNIVTGVGFVGAGVIFKEGINVRGVTTAAIIWVAAAIGMAIGFGNYWLAASTLLLVLLSLLILSKMERKLETVQNIDIYKIVFDKNQYSVNELEHSLTQIGVVFKRIRIAKQLEEITICYEIEVPSLKTADVASFFMDNLQIQSFTVEDYKAKTELNI
jgi:putative Mg2+ transporter-C (MgtC) family protein